MIQIGTVGCAVAVSIRLASDAVVGEKLELDPVLTLPVVVVGLGADCGGCCFFFKAS